MGIESEFTLVVDGEPVRPESLWPHPSAFIKEPLLARDASSAQLATGGAVYFDGGVLEVATPVIELEPGCAARAVRSLWEQIGLLRHELTRWAEQNRHDARLTGFSAHYNVSFEAPAGRRIEDAALLLAQLLPAPVAFLGASRRSTGVGVRPRGDRMEITADFTPDPALMIATATFIVGVVRGVQAWPSWHLAVLDQRGIPTLAGVTPGRHSSRQGWLAKDYDFPRSPFTTPVDARVWPMRDGRTLSLRALSRELYWRFRHDVRGLADPVSRRLLASVLDGRTPSLLELPDRPAAYEDVGHACRWGVTIPELRAHARDGRWEVPDGARWSSGSFVDHVAEREEQRTQNGKRKARAAGRARGRTTSALPAAAPTAPTPAVRPVAGEAGYRGLDRRGGEEGDTEADRRVRPAVLERRIQARAPAPSLPGRLARSSYEEVFLRLVAGTRLTLDGQAFRPAGLRGWSEARFRNEADGTERTLTLDALREMGASWSDDPPRAT